MSGWYVCVCVCQGGDLSGASLSVQADASVFLSGYAYRLVTIDSVDIFLSHRCTKQPQPSIRCVLM